MKKTEGFSEEEKAAMKERARELKAKKGDGEKDVQEKIAAMPEPFHSMGERLHKLIKEAAPELSAKTWYGMPSYSNKDGKTIIFFRSGHMFKEPFMTLGFNQHAQLAEGNMWPVAYALTELTSTEEKRIVELVKKAVG